MQNNNLFGDHQYGFTTLQLLKFLDKLTKALDVGYLGGTIYMLFIKPLIKFHRNTFLVWYQSLEKLDRILSKFMHPIYLTVKGKNIHYSSSRT